MKPFAALALALLASAATAQIAPRRPQPQPAARSAQAAPQPGGALLTSTQGVFDRYVREGRTPGIVGAFGVGDIPTAFVAAGRIATDPSAPAAGPDTLWRVYSMTKPVTGMAVMLLIEEGKLGLDDPVSRYIPAFARMRVLTDPEASLASVPATRPITIRHLLTHTAGLSYSITAKGPLLKEYERLGLIPLALNPAAEDPMKAVRPRTLAEFADRLATVPLVAQPGTAWNYSVGLDLLGRVVEVASGMPFDRFLQTRFFAPLGMRSTFFTVPATDAARLATMYAVLGDRLAPLDAGATSVFLRAPSFPYGGAGLVSSARDYDRFLQMLADGGRLGTVRVLKEETVRLGMSDLLPPGVTFTGMGGERQGYGAGGFVELQDRPGGLSRGAYGWGGAAGTLGWVDPAKHARGTVMVNYIPGSAHPLATDVRAALAADAQRLHGR